MSVLRLLSTAASLWKSAACRGGGGSPANIRWRSSIVALCVTITAHSLTVTDWLNHRRAATLALPHVPAAHHSRVDNEQQSIPITVASSLHGREFIYYFTNRFCRITSRTAPTPFEDGVFLNESLWYGCQNFSFNYDFRHANDRNISIFVQTYLKFELEYNVNESFGRTSTTDPVLWQWSK